MLNGGIESLTITFGSGAIYTAAVVLVYDYVLTLRSEIRYIWKARLSFVDALFLAIRYSAFSGAAFALLTTAPFETWEARMRLGIYNLLQRYPPNDKIPAVVSRSNLLITSAFFLTAARGQVFTAVRVFAIFDHAWWLFVFVAGIGMATPVITGYVFFEFILIEPLYVTPGATTCNGSYTISSQFEWSHKQHELAQRQAYWLMAARASSLLADGIVLALTWMKLYRNHMLPDVTRPHISTILLKDTGIFFGLMSIVNTLGLCVGNVLIYGAMASLWASSLTSILSCRLLLSLRETSDPSGNTEDSLSRVLEQALFGIDQDHGQSQVLELDVVEVPVQSPPPNGDA
ncbi:uncharacterized protein FIBRA_01590 [Fibroporia radiculosa]|uniref:DUF6533 domain-containing protein n=1 Tax=Fibroporia radiculosa TaxID=599839 RepID=J4HTK7_9APHY|nr:uncharacterized protein FIBRA_01590 [Fibroporia radiculosa]CCL99572.1 predicted protein [Fibroporia radiculosa]